MKAQKTQKMPTLEELEAQKAALEVAIQEAKHEGENKVTIPVVVWLAAGEGTRSKNGTGKMMMLGHFDQQIKLPDGRTARIFGNVGTKLAEK